MTERSTLTRALPMLEIAPPRVIFAGFAYWGVGSSLAVGGSCAKRT